MGSRERLTERTMERGKPLPQPPIGYWLLATGYWTRFTIHDSRLPVFPLLQSRSPSVPRSPEACPERSRRVPAFLFPFSLVPCRGPQRQVLVAEVAWSLVPRFYPPPQSFTPPLPLRYPTPYLSGPSVPQSRSPEVPAITPPPHTFRTPPPMPFCETVKL